MPPKRIIFEDGDGGFIVAELAINPDGSPQYIQGLNEVPEPRIYTYKYVEYYHDYMSAVENINWGKIR